METSTGEFTRLLKDCGAGNREALDRLLPLVYEELRRLAAHKMTNESLGHTLRPTALVHEAWLRLIGGEQPTFENRAHFFAISAQLMRRILVDHARRNHRAKRGGPMRPVSLDEAPAVSAVHGEDLIAVDEALERLAAIDARSARVVELRFFGGMSVPEMAEVLKVSHMTVSRDWEFARAWLAREFRVDASKGDRQSD